MTVTNDESIRGTDEQTVARLYGDVIAGWNESDADSFARPFSPDAVVIGFDGSEMTGRASIASELRRIFADHATAIYVAKVKSVRLISPDVALLRAVVGMAPRGESELMPDRNVVVHPDLSDEQEGDHVGEMGGPEGDKAVRQVPVGGGRLDGERQQRDRDREHGVAEGEQPMGVSRHRGAGALSG